MIDYEQSLFFLQSVEQNARHANGHACDCRPRFARLAASPLARACTPVTKPEEKEGLLAVYEVDGRLYKSFLPGKGNVKAGRLFSK